MCRTSLQEECFFDPFDRERQDEDLARGPAKKHDDDHSAKQIVCPSTDQDYTFECNCECDNSPVTRNETEKEWVTPSKDLDYACLQSRVPRNHQERHQAFILRRKIQEQGVGSIRGQPIHQPCQK